MKNKLYLWIVCCIFLCISGCNNAEMYSTYNNLVVGDEYAAYVDETGRLSILYDNAGATVGVDLSKQYKGLGDDRTYLVTIDVDGNVWTAYPYSADEVEEQLKDLYNDVAENGGNMGSGQRNTSLMRNFGMLTNVKQIISDYPYSFLVLLENGTIQNGDGIIYESANETSQFAKDENGAVASISEDGILTFYTGDALRKKTFEEWTGKFLSIYAGTYFVGLKENGTVIAEDAELNHLINNVERWKNIRNLTVAENTIVGLKNDGTVVAVCKTGTNKGQCEVDKWEGIVAVGTNGKVTIGITKDGNVVSTKK